MKLILALLFPLLFFGQQKDEWSIAMQSAMKDIQNEDYRSAIANLDKSLEIVPKNPSAYYFKGYLQIILGEQDNGCKTLVDAIFYNSNSAKKLYPEKCIDYNPKLNPDKFKKGKFSLEILDGSLNYSFERENNMQHEKFEGKVYSGKIIWLKNGDYTIIATASTEKIMAKNPKFFTRILKIEGNEYLYEKIEENRVQFGLIKKLE